MRAGVGRVVLIAAVCIGCASCSVTRKIPDGQYLVQKVRIEDDKSTPRKERIRAAELERYVRQSPNKRFLGLNVGVWLYEQANPDKHNWWNNWKRRIGQEPVLLDMDLTERSAKNLKVYMDSRGFLSSEATYEVDTTSRRKRASITYRTRQLLPYRIDSISYDFRDKFLEQIILPDTAHTLIRRGDIFDITRLNEERERIASYLKDRGYYNFSVNNIEYIADTLAGDHLVDLKVVVKQYLTGYDARGEAVMDNHTVYRIDRDTVVKVYHSADCLPDVQRERELARKALVLGIPTAIHESNVYPGLTTRALADKVDLVMVGFPEAASYYQNARRVEVTGTPVRGEFFTLDRTQARQVLGLPDSQPLVVSFWGSQGAGHMSAHTVDLVELWASEGRRFHYIHAAGRDYEDMKEELARRKVSVTDSEVRPYIDDMPVVMAAADLVICRAGASTLGELTALGKPAILVPSPFVAANHQYKNAKVLADRGGAVLIEEKDCTGEKLYRAALELLADGSRIKEALNEEQEKK